MYKDEKKAEKAALEIRKHNSQFNNDRFSVDLVRENGTTHAVYTGWKGYFESLSYVEVASFVVDANKRQRY